MKRQRVLAILTGVIVLSAGLMLTSVHRGAQAAPPPNNPGTPFQAILDKLDQVLAAITGAAGQSNHTLRWDTNNPSATRFTTAFTGAVLDHNTGLVWEQAPTITSEGRDTWDVATFYCVNKTVGGTTGWRLPSVVELKSVQDPTLSAPFVPLVATGGVLTDVLSARYWSATAVVDRPNLAWAVDFSNGTVPNFFNKTSTLFIWCVRGGMQADQY